MATGTIEPRHIATPIRRFCKRAQFHQARMADISLVSKHVTLQRISDKSQKTISYDYLVLAMGGKTNFFGNENVAKYSFTIKNLDDATHIRNHIITMLEEADQEVDVARQKELMTFVVVGGRFSGVETVGELNDFVRESCQKFYRNIAQDTIKVILVASGQKILPEIGSLGGYSKKALEKSGVIILTNTRLKDMSASTVLLDNGKNIPSKTVIWAGGNTVEYVIKKLDTEHDRSGRLAVDKHLRLKNHPEVYSLGDCICC